MRSMAPSPMIHKDNCSPLPKPYEFIGKINKQKVKVKLKVRVKVGAEVKAKVKAKVKA